MGTLYMDDQTVLVACGLNLSGRFCFLGKPSHKAGAEMALAEDLEKELETTAQEVLGKLRSRQLFQSRWDTAAFIIFLIFLGTVLLLLLLVCIHCCCYSCCSRRTSRSQKEHRRGVDNLALEP
ncbi:small integral membrane protein 22 isoform X2 [Prionailurus viverrinus]|uniref:small integral membrane protein 22 isoform X2 n=1 Tax=Prionailurus viverrinus TaxID=61388 RepID=UPI001FF275E0|nr:small integral membrane protein 22 isoform X2 [Prionailurus viverrinus]